MTWVYERYLFHEWVFWPVAVMEIAKASMRGIYGVLAWLPAKLHELAHKDPAELLELVSAVSALLVAFTGIAEVPITWKIQAGLVGLIQVWMLCRGQREGRFVAMIIATVFWWTLMFALLPRRMTGYHVFLVPLCIAYTVTVYALLHDHRNP